MTGMPTRMQLAVLLVSAAVAMGALASPALALNPIKPVCSAASLVSGLIGKACSAVQHGDRLLSAGKNLVTGHFGGAVKSLVGESNSSIASKATTALALAAMAAWVVGGASYVLHETSAVLNRTTDPQLTTTWFSGTYWRVAGIAAILTLPFLFAAAIQAIVQSDITLLVRAALGYLPLALLAVGIAAPLTMLLLSASDQLAAVVSSAAGHQSAGFLNQDSGLIGALSRVSSSAFLGFFAGLLTVAAAIALWLELMVRAAAVYVIVLMLPLAFAAFVWPARRLWAVRSVELLVALILSKFVIVAVLSLGGAALSQSVHHSAAGMLAGVALLALGVFAPWSLLRLLPVTELASAAAGSLRHDGSAAFGGAGRADAQANEGERWAAKAAQMRREARETEPLDAANAAKDGLAVREASGPVADSPASAAAEGLAAPTAIPTPDAGARHPASAEPGGPVAPESHARDGEAPGERISGMPEMWQAENGTWNPVILGPQASRVWPPDEPAGGHRDHDEPGPADQTAPTPPPQDPQDGRL
jgi:hypothetical protein